jgi:uncharacterized DUF497 family protein
MNYEMTEHARDVLQERQIPIEWMERALGRPTLSVPSQSDPSVESRFVRIAEFGNRVLRVVVNKHAVPERVISVYFDRSMKGKL